MDILAEQQRREFGVWLRTGRRPMLGDGRGFEVKFNPWHDPRDGRFTFDGAGRYYGSGNAAAQDNGHNQRVPKFSYVEDQRLPPISTKDEADAWRAAELAKYGHKPERRRAIEEQYQRYLAKLADEEGNEAGAVHEPTRSDGQQGVDERQRRSSHQSDRRDHANVNPARSSAPQTQPSRRSRSWNGGGFTGGGGGFGGGGATGSWEDTSKPQARHTQMGQVATVSARPADRWRPVSSNGYLYEIDEENRTRRVSGEITLNVEQGRSRSAQLAAGGPDRRASDQGGHYIARRFNGPTEAFNHFAQDGNFNRGDYARLEEEWARAKRSGKNVRVKIVPVYEGSSQRPSRLNVWFWIDGTPKSANFPNEAQGGKSGKR